MTIYFAWWLLALGLGLAELLTGTFYLLILALGAAAGGVAAWAGLTLVAQILIAAAVALGGWLLLKRMRGAARDAASGDTDGLLDAGARVNIEHWSSTRQGKVRYRGAEWAVELAEGEADGRPGEHQIKSVRGTRLIVTRVGSEP